MKTQQNIELSIRDKVAIVTLNRPDKKNAFDESMFGSLEAITLELNQALPRVVVITGEGTESFSSGFDVNPENPMVTDFLKSMESGQPESAKGLIRRIRKAVDSFLALPVPIIAAINGLAYGGGAELAVRCDLRIMDQKAEICFSEVRLGLMPDWGGGAALAKLLGSAVAADLVLTARKISSEEALKLGLVNQVAVPGESLNEALDKAQMIAANGPKAVQHALRMIRGSRDLNLNQTLELEEEMASNLIASGECIEGVAAFFEKRKPNFQD